jgi:hypothetical protein
LAVEDIEWEFALKGGVAGKGKSCRIFDIHPTYASSSILRSPPECELPLFTYLRTSSADQIPKVINFYIEHRRLACIQLYHCVLLTPEQGNSATDRGLSLFQHGGKT